MPSKPLTRRGWRRVKLYFMIGFPGETDEDVGSIARLIHSSLKGEQGARFPGLKLSVSLSTLVPKAHTPFQWAAQVPVAETVRRQGLLKEALRNQAGPAPLAPGGDELPGGPARAGDRRCCRW